MNAAQPGAAAPATPGSQKKKRKKKPPRRQWSVDFSKNCKGFSLAVIKEEQASTGVHVQRNKSRIKALKDIQSGAY